MDRLISVIVTEHEVIKMIIDKKMFFCIECSKYQTIMELWSYEEDKDYSWWGMCNSCNNKKE